LTVLVADTNIYANYPQWLYFEQGQLANLGTLGKWPLTEGLMYVDYSSTTDSF